MVCSCHQVRMNGVLEVVAMLETGRNACDQMHSLMSRLALAGLAVTALAVALVALLGAG